MEEAILQMTGYWDFSRPIPRIEGLEKVVLGDLRKIVPWCLSAIQ
jgi:hypothetical protein